MSSNKNSLRGILRRALAQLLAFLMVFGLAVSGLNVRNAYATELPNEGVNEDHSDATIFKWKKTGSSGDPMGVSWRYDLQGLRSGTSYATNPGASSRASDTSNNIRTSYGDGGYPSFLFENQSDNSSVPGTAGKTFLSHHGGSTTEGANNGHTETVASMGVEFREKVSISPDKNFIYVDYWLYDKKGPGQGPGGSNVRTFFIASGTDTNIGNYRDDADFAKCEITDRGFTMTNAYTKEVFECITHDADQGLTDPDYRWIGYYGSYYNNMFNNMPAPASVGGPPNGSPGAVDSAIAFAWKIDLHPYETVHKRIAYSIRAASYYVSSAHGADNASHDGTYNQPFKTIEYALNKIGNHKGFIYIQDYDPLTAPIDFPSTGGGSSQEVNISSTNRLYNGSGVTPSQLTIQRAPGYSGTMLKVTGGKKLAITQIKFDGVGTAGTDPLVDLTGGTLSFTAGMAVTGANNTDTSATAKGAAINISGGSLTLNGANSNVQITGNKSAKGGKAAVNVAGGTVTVSKEVTIDNNTYTYTDPITSTSVTKKANVYLPAGQSIQVDDDLGSGKIGVTSKTEPAASLAGSINKADQEVIIAKPTSAYLANLGGTPDVNSPFTGNFTSDDDRFTVSIGTKFPGAPPLLPAFNNLNYTVLQREGKQITFVYVDEQGATIAAATVPPSNNPTSKLYAKKEAVTVLPPAAVANYNLKEVSISPASAYVTTGTPTDKLLLDNTATSPTFAKITGFMPDEDVTVTYTYSKDAFKLKFDTKGGIPQPGEITGETGDTVSGLFPSSVVKYGYNFVDWKVNGTTQTALPATFSTTVAPFNLYTPAQKEITYVANYTPNTSVKFDYKVEYTNADGSINFLTDTSQTGTNGNAVEANISAERKGVPYYEWNEPSGANASGVDPNSYIFNDTTIPAWSFDTTSPHNTPAYGHFAWRMPGQATTVSYRYRVNSDVRTNQPTLTIKHVNHSGTVLQQTSGHFYPEETITAAPAAIFGYTLDPNGWQVTQTYTAGEHSGNLYSVAATENDTPSPFDANGVYNGKMPNQDVTITYTYTGSGAGLEFKVQHEDNDTLDPLLKTIQFPAAPSAFAFANPETSSPAIDSVVNAAPLAAPHDYGYLPITAAGSTHTASVPANQVTPSTPLWDAAFHYTAKMPTNDLQITYGYKRDASAWGTVKFYSGLDAVGGTEQATLAQDADVSPDVTANGTNSFKTDVLKKNAAGQGFTFGELKARRQVPKAAANDGVHYMVDGWFVDLNGNRILDGSEHLLADSDQFNGGEDLVAHIAENPSGWADINIGPFDSHVTWAAGAPTTLHVWVDKPWSQIEPFAENHMVAGVSTPNYTGEVNYLRKGWFHGTAMMSAGDAIQNGETYLIKYYPDPAVFGTPVHPVDAGGSLDTQGKGVVTAYNTKPGYKYIVVDPDGKVVGVGDGSVAGRTYFNNLTPGTTYKVYEAEGDNTAQVGDDIANVPAPISTPTDAHVPAVDTNKQITYNPDDETKVDFTIDPSDKDADYALIDENGNVVTTPETQADGWQAGTPGRIKFTGLNANKKYTVVARPHGRNDITPLSKLPDGTEVVMDPGGEIDIPKFSITTTDGESQIDTVNGNAINAAYFDEAHKDEPVVLTAPATNSAGETFKGWRVTTGVIPGVTGLVTNTTLTFTMPDTNVVLTAYYNRNLNGNAPVTDEIRGGNPGEMALDPNEIPGLENQLTTPADQVLMNVNHADVDYKVVYTKKNVPANVANALKSHPAVEAANHPSAFTAAWEVETRIERYVNGRLVQRTTPSNATFRTYVQLDREDVNNLDYQLLRYDTSVNDYVPETLTPADPYASGGLFQFTAQEGVKYYLTYSKAYKVTWINNRDTNAPWPQYSFPVRKGEAPSDGDYSTQYGTVTNNEPSGSAAHQTDTATGIEYTWKGWSRKEDKYKPFDDTAAIKKRTIVYGYWQDNKKEVDDARSGLEDAIKKALKLADDFFLKRKETAALINGVPGEHTGINDAIAVFERTSPRATAAELQQALDDLLDVMKRYDNTLNPRYNHYNKITDDNLSGGASGGGGGRGNGGRSGSGGGGGGRSSHGGSGALSFSTAGGPSLSGKEGFVADYEKGYTVGTNGNWELINPEHSEWIFTLNGGIRLVSRWAKLDYANGDVNKNGWYHFNSHGIMDFGWFLDEKLNWYYCNTEHDGWLGKMKTGWHYDEADKHWYYLDPATGVMQSGWQEIGGKWYYFAPTTSQATYEYDAVNESWFYKASSTVRPMGSMYQNETTPDGYRVDANGAWIH